MELLRGAVLRRRAAASRAGRRWVQSGDAVGRGADDAAPALAAAADQARASRSKAVPTPIATAMALVEQLEHPESSRIGRSLLSRPIWTPDAEGSGLTNEELERARECLESLQERVERECYDEKASEEQAMTRREKAMTRRLGRMLVGLMRQGNYRDVEAIAFLWDDVFPQHANNAKHWGVICEHYAVALNKQKRYSEVVEKLFTNWLVTIEEEDAESATTAMARQWVLTPATVPAVLLACGHLHDVDNAVRALRIAHEWGVQLDESAYRQFLNAMILDDPTGSFDSVMQVCEVIVDECGDRVPLLVLPRLIRAAAERGEVHRAMKYYHHSPNASMNPHTELHFEVCLLTLWDMRCTDELLLILKHVVESRKASYDMKERICKALLRKSVEERKDDCRETAMQVTIGILELMETHRIRASNKPFPMLLAALLEDEHIKSVDGFVEFFSKFPHVMEWNAFIMCELLLIAVRLKHVSLIDDLVAHALNNGIPIKYVALESVVAFYYRTGKFNSVEKAADIIQALRKNKHIPLGMALSEIGMMCNTKLGRYEEVILLFEDFARLDGDRKRILTRKPMLKAAAKAYMKLRRYDEANAMRQLLKSHFEDDSSESVEDWSDSEDEVGEDEAEQVKAHSM